MILAEKLMVIILLLFSVFSVVNHQPVGIWLLLCWYAKITKLSQFNEVLTLKFLTLELNPLILSLSKDGVTMSNYARTVFRPVAAGFWLHSCDAWPVVAGSWLSTGVDDSATSARARSRRKSRASRAIIENLWIKKSTVLRKLLAFFFWDIVGVTHRSCK